MELEVVHETRYEYTAPVALAHHLAHLQPLQDAHQQLLAFDMDIEPSAARASDSLDAMGNAQRHFSLVQPHEALCVRARSRVRLQPRFQGLEPDTSPPWSAVAASLRYVAQAHYEPALEYALPSRYVPRLKALREYGKASLTAGRPLAAAAIELMQRIHADFKYQSLSTDVDTPMSQVLLQRRGVCQDFAHLMAGVLRMWGLPARYVSGYLLTHAPDEDGAAANDAVQAPQGSPMLGADASHAWVQVWCPGTTGVPADGWLDLDPTNNLVPGTGHVRVAVGRDFGDVTPLRGVIRGGGHHTLTVGVSTRRVPAGDVAATREHELLQ